MSRQVASASPYDTLAQAYMPMLQEVALVDGKPALMLGPIAIVATGLKDATLSRSRTVQALTLGDPLAEGLGERTGAADRRRRLALLPVAHRGLRNADERRELRLVQPCRLAAVSYSFAEGHSTSIAIAIVLVKRRI